MKRKKVWGMNAPFATYVLLPLAVLVVSPFIFQLVNQAAFHQATDQVVVREPGRRTLGPPIDAAPEARGDSDFALLSEAAYQEKVGPRASKNGTVIDANRMLEDRNWKRWDDFPRDDTPDNLKSEIDSKHLRLEVWSNASANQVAITFGGTVGRNKNDWKSDLRWFIHKRDRDDEYTLIVKKFGGAFVKEYERKEQVPEFAFLRHAQLFSTGHSLGGGLAHQFAYSLPPDPAVPRVSKVYAFDPSPVTGYYSVDKQLREDNSKCLKIDRIYERGEILAFFRALVNLVYPPTASQPAIRQVRYSLFHTLNPISGHSMTDLAYGISQVANHQELAAMP